MTVDEQIQLAERIALSITNGLRHSAKDEKEARELIKASRNEWMRWCQIVKGFGLEKGISYAKYLGKDITMRSNIKKINHQISEVVKSHKAQFAALPTEQRNRILGYIAWYLRIIYSFG